MRYAPREEKQPFGAPRSTLHPGHRTSGDGPVGQPWTDGAEMARPAVAPVAPAASVQDQPGPSLLGWEWGGVAGVESSGAERSGSPGSGPPGMAVPVRPPRPAPAATAATLTLTL